MGAYAPLPYHVASPLHARPLHKAHQAHALGHNQINSFRGHALVIF